VPRDDATKSGKLESRTFNEGRVHLFRRTDYKKPIWQVRLKIPGSTGYAFKSTKTTDEYAAYMARCIAGNEAELSRIFSNTNKEETIGELAGMARKLIFENKLIP